MSTISPLVPAECDLRDFPFMPVDIIRLFGSEFHARANDTEWRAGVTLWLKSFHQVPAASLPNEDVALARLAEFGRDVKPWRKVRAMALHGWAAASDGRLYHPVVAEKALEAWVEKLGQRKASGAGNARRWGIPFDPAVLDLQTDKAKALLAALNPQSRVLRRKPRGTDGGNPVGIPDGSPTGTPVGIAERIPDHSQETGTEISRVPSQGVEFPRLVVRAQPGGDCPAPSSGWDDEAPFGRVPS